MTMVVWIHMRFPYRDEDGRALAHASPPRPFPLLPLFLQRIYSETPLDWTAPLR